MANLSMVIVPSKQLANGKHKVRLALAHHGETKYILSDVILDYADQLRNGTVVNHPRQKEMNLRLRTMMNDMMDALYSIRNPDGLSCEQLKELLINKRNNVSITMEGLADIIIKNGRNKEHTISVYKYAVMNWNQFVGNIPISMITPSHVDSFVARMIGKNYSNTTITMRLSAIHKFLNYARKNRICTWEIDPFINTRRFHVQPRNCNITVEQLKAVRDSTFKKRNTNIVRDIFMLSFYLGGMNIVDMLKLKIDPEDKVITFVRQKTKDRKLVENETVLPIVPEAREIINKYVGSDGHLYFIDKYKTSYDIRGVLQYQLNLIADIVGIKGRFIYYSARKTFAQIAYDNGVQESTIEYLLGESMKTNRPIYSYFRVMLSHAQDAMKKIMDAVR